MATRNKRLRDFLRWTGRTQSNLPLSAQLERELVAPLEARVEGVEVDVAQLQATFASGVVQALDLELDGRSAGAVDVDGVFPEAQIGAPIVVSPIVGDELELGVVFAASVIAPTRLRVFWFSTSTSAPRRVRVAFIIGAQEE